MSVVHVVTENAGYDVGLIVRGMFSTPAKAEGWMTAAHAQYEQRVRDGMAAAWGRPSYDVEEYQIDEVAP